MLMAAVVSNSAVTLLMTCPSSTPIQCSVWSPQIYVGSAHVGFPDSLHHFVEAIDDCFVVDVECNVFVGVPEAVPGPVQLSSQDCLDVPREASAGSSQDLSVLVQDHPSPSYSSQPWVCTPFSSTAVASRCESDFFVLIGVHAPMGCGYPMPLNLSAGLSQDAEVFHVGCYAPAP